MDDTTQRTPPAREMFPCPRCAEQNAAGANFCSRCALAFNAPPPTPAAQPQVVYLQQAAPAKKTNLAAILAVCILGVCAALYFAVGGINTRGGSGRSLGGASSSPRSVVYKVGGTTGRASLTYENETGNTQQEEVNVPWSKKITVARGSFLYVSAQNKQSSGTITCEILVDGKKVEEASSSGAYVIAGCSGSAP